MPDRATIKTNIILAMNRNPASFDATLNKYIDYAVAFIGDVVASVYDEERWDVTITTAMVSANQDNWEIPGSTKAILAAYYRDVSGDEDSEYPIKVVPNIDHATLDDNIPRRRYPFGAGPSYDYSSSDVTWPTGLGRRVGRSNYQGIPELVYRMGKNVYYHPRPGTEEVDNELGLILAVKPASLTANTGAGSTNTITDNMSNALELYVMALVWLLHFSDRIRGQTAMSAASIALQAFTSQDELSRLTNVSIQVHK